MIGNLTRDIELKYLPSGAAVAKSAIATSYKYKSGDGQQKEEVCFLDFNVFGKAAEILNQYTRKGSKVMLEGRLVLEQWTANDGTNRNRHTLRVDEFKFLDSKADSMGSGGNEYNQQPQQQMGYNQNNGGYQQQNNYQQQQPAQNNMNNMQSNQGGTYNPNNVPTIDIDEDEIPF
jgi:single-strand DNA-binding protein